MTIERNAMENTGPNRPRKRAFRKHQSRLNKKWPPSDRNREARTRRAAHEARRRREAEERKK